MDIPPQSVITTFAVEWGLIVSKVEIMLIDPPGDIKRAMRLLATGEFEAAEQQKKVMIHIML